MSPVNEHQKFMGGIAGAGTDGGGGGCGSAPEGTTSPLRGQRYWRSIEDYTKTQEFSEFMHREFPAGAAELLADDRRTFIKLMGASLALAGLGLAGCRRWPEEKIAPYAHRPEGRIDGTPVHYATAMELGGVATGIVVKSYDGRPIKIEGNESHPVTGWTDPVTGLKHGPTDAITQAAVLDLYDQDRSLTVMHDGKPSTWAAFETFIGEHAAGMTTNGRGVRVLCEASSSPTLASLRAAFLAKYAGSAWVEYEPLGDDAQRAGLRAAFGRPMRPHYALDQARVVVSLDSDFLLTHPAMLKLSRDFTRGRRADDAGKTMNRLYSVESTLTLTGAMADERVAMRSADIAAAAAYLAEKLLGSAAATASAKLHNTPAWSAVDARATEVLDAAVADIQAAPGHAVVMVGPRQPAEIHALAAAINAAVAGSVISYTSEPDADRPTYAEAITTLAREMASGTVETLVIIGANPVYTAPADLDFSSALAKVKTSIHLGYYNDETGRACTWHVPRAHFLESWGDARAYDGTLSVVQPLILPMIDAAQGGKSAIEFVNVLAGGPAANGLELVRRTFGDMLGGEGPDAEARWRRILHEGWMEGTAWEAGPATAAAGALSGLSALADRLAAAKADEVEVVFFQDGKVYDGRFANNGWLQELPDQITKLVWDNAALMSPAMASRLGVKRGDMVEISSGGRNLTVAAFPLPGHADRSVSVALGYGRGDAAGRIGAGAGFNAYALRTTTAMHSAPATVTKATGSYPLASTQDHGAANPVADKGIQDRLPTLVREGTREEYVKHPKFAKAPPGYHVAHRLSLWDEDKSFHEATAYGQTYNAWAMTIDLSTCTGCSACVTACQAENNIPVVGKDQVSRGREMHWIRIDRYFAFTPTKHDSHGVPTEYDMSKLDRVAIQPVTCQHCENAPCEQVCPVAATVHDDDGLNVMVYNRCIGTRYCSNNCPYKVRRFNYFDFHRRDPVREGGGWLHVKPEYYVREGADQRKQMQFNPDVTVRMRGVMEKCTFCVQRITKGKIEAKNRWARQGGSATTSANPWGIADGEITTACAQACPSQAIVFGDLKDPNSRVSRLTRHERSYEMLEELNTKPRLKYLARLRNPALAEAAPPHGHDVHDSHDGHDHGKDAHG